MLRHVSVQFLITTLCWILLVNDTATTAIYTSGHTHSQHDDLPVMPGIDFAGNVESSNGKRGIAVGTAGGGAQVVGDRPGRAVDRAILDRKSTRLNSSH